MVEIRKLITTRETIFSDLGVTAPRPVVRAVGMAVIRKRYADGFVFGSQLVHRELGRQAVDFLAPDTEKLCQSSC